MNWLEEQIPHFDEAFDALERGDLDAFMEALRDQTHPECEFHSGIGSVIGGATYKGPDGISGWFGDLIESTSERHWRNRRYEPHADRIMVFLADFDFIGAASGVPVTNETGAVFEYEDRLLVRVNSFISYGDAREFAEARGA
jgi:SnoaL-like domain